MSLQNNFNFSYILNVLMCINMYNLYNEYNKNDKIKYNLKDLKLDKYYKCKLENVYCSICCDVVKCNEFVRKLPCKHKFHKKCVDKWLKTLLKKSENTNCPLCRKNILNIN